MLQELSILLRRSLRVGPEWNTFNKDEIPGSSSQRHVGGSLSASEIGSEVHTQVEAECTSNSSFKSRKTKSTRNQALNQTLKELSEMGERLNASRSVVERAQTIFKTVQEGNLLKGRPSDAIAAACLHLACRQEDVGRTFKEMCAVSKVSKKEIGRCTKLLESALGTTLVPKSSVVCAADFIPRVCSNLSLPVEVQNAALDIARKSTDLDTVMGRSPVSVSAAAIYMASQVVFFKVEVLYIFKKTVNE